MKLPAGVVTLLFALECGVGVTMIPLFRCSISWCRVCETGSESRFIRPVSITSIAGTGNLIFGGSLGEGGKLPVLRSLPRPLVGSVPSGAKRRALGGGGNPIHSTIFTATVLNNCCVKLFGSFNPLSVTTSTSPSRFASPRPPVPFRLSRINSRATFRFSFSSSPSSSISSRKLESRLVVPVVVSEERVGTTGLPGHRPCSGFSWEARLQAMIRAERRVNRRDAFDPRERRFLAV
jgi:hypothetical protein